MTITTDPTRDELLTDFGKATLTDRYLLPGESYQDLFARVSKAYQDDDAHGQRIYDYMSRHWFLPATPVLSNGGAGRGLPISCFLNSVEDSMDSIADIWRENVSLASKGGGIGTSYANVRSIGEKVGLNGKTSGVIPFLKVQDSMTLGVSQGSLRRGSSAVYLPVWHPEIEEFVEIRKPTGGDPNRRCLNIHHGVVIDDKFMEAVTSGAEYDLVSPKTGETIKTVDARALWIKMLTTRIEQGEAYMLFIDTVSRARPDIYKRLGLETTTSNLCVAGETRILTSEGYKEIQSLAGQNVTLWNGVGWSESRVEKTSDNARLRKIEFSNGAVIWATDEHKFYVWVNGAEVEKSAVTLSRGDITKNFFPNGGWCYFDVLSNGTEFKEEATYCANEPKRHRIMLEGILTGNCNEIVLTTGKDHTGNDRTAVCCLSSLNLETWDEWKDNPQFIEDVMRFLDNVLQDFIDRAPDSMSRARYAAERERSVGLGVMGWHSSLQARSIPFESVMAKVWNKRIFKHIREQADQASAKLAHEKGACPDAIDAGIMERFTHKMAVAPTASISIIAGCTSPGIEPISANVFLQKTLSGSFTVRNRHLKQVLAAHGQDTDKVWSDITLSKGSVQHLDFLTDLEKDVYKTAFELDQRWVVEHAADRAPHIDQGQSVNLFLPADVHKKDLHAIHFMAWKKGLKGLYYLRSLSIQRAENVSDAVGVAADNVRPRTDVEECLACQ